MSKVIVLGAGFAGHTAALYLRKRLAEIHEVHVISPQSYFQFMPSLVWVGVGHMKPEETIIDLMPVYRKQGIRFTIDRAVEIHVEKQAVVTASGESYEYDYLINATGPYLNFEGTSGLGPKVGYTHSICTKEHAGQAAEAYLKAVQKMKAGERQTIVAGTGHAGSTCQGAAFEYVQNIHYDLLHQGLRDMCDLVWFSNEAKLGDLGMGAFVFNVKGELRESEELTDWLMRDCNIRCMIGSRPIKIEQNKLFWENVRGEEGCLDYDFAMLIPQFIGQKIRYINAEGEDISDKMSNPAGLMKVDADYESGPRGYANWKAEDWPSAYQSPLYPNIFAAGIAFAPPHPISAPSGITASGVTIHAAPPRTGMIACIIGRMVADNIADMIQNDDTIIRRRIPMSKMPAACVASQRKSIATGSAIMVALYPVVPDYTRYPVEHGGRNMKLTTYEIGKASAWIKRILHHMFLYKMAAKPGWSYIPE
ncbi:MAG: sulfide:quinone reductase [Firmicutes bacterium]|nr:sulfide:quinone reductase [Bacillota bacterium]